MNPSHKPFDDVIKLVPQVIVDILKIAIPEGAQYSYCQFKDLATELIEVLRRYTDLLFIIEATDSSPRRIIHVEYQSVYDLTMPERMLLYCMMVFLKYKIIPEQYCINLFETDSQEVVVQRLKESETYSISYTEINICNLNPSDFIDNPDLGVASFSVLMDIEHGKEKAILEYLFTRISKADISEKQKSDYVVQIDYLCRLRKEKLTGIFIEILSRMSVIIDVAETALYKFGQEKGHEEGVKQGVKKGIKEGVKRGVKKGELAGKFEMAIELWKNNISLDVIKKSAKLSDSEWQAFLSAIGQSEV